MPATLVLNPSRGRAHPARNRFGQFMRGRRHNPHRHKGYRHRRNPSYAFDGQVHVPEMVYENPQRHRRHHRRRNPDFDSTLREATLGVGGVNEMLGLVSGAFAAQMIPTWFSQLFLKGQPGLTGWADVVATGLGASAAGIGAAQINRSFGQSAAAGGLTIALMKAVSMLTGGRYGLRSNSPSLSPGTAMIAAPQPIAAPPAPARVISGLGL